MLNIYRASAGSGKTYQLTNEFVMRLFEDAGRFAHRRIMAVTFTNKATEEMRMRIINALFELAHNQNQNRAKEISLKLGMSENEIVSKSQQLLFDILHDYHFFAVSTIDRFFQQILRAFARETGIAGNYNIELDTIAVLMQASDNMMINLSDPDKQQLLQWLTDIACNMIEEGQGWNIRQKMQRLGSQIFKEKFQNLADKADKKLHDKRFLKEYTNKLKAIITDVDENIKLKSKNILLLMEKFGLQHEDFAFKKTKKFERLLEEPTSAIGERVAQMRNVEGCYTKKSPAKAKIEFAYANGMQLAVNDLLDFIEGNMRWRNSAIIILKNIGNLGVISDLLLEINKLMNERDAFLLSDTNLLLNKIIAESDSPFIYEKTGIFINHFMIDEFQDTSVLQWKNFKPLISNSIASGNANMLVGDVKQSIYRWRNSDWRLLDEQIFNDFKQTQIAEIQLDKNWRSDRNIIEFNNSFFSIAPAILYNELKDNILKNNFDFEKFKDITEKIPNAYRHVNQQVSAKAQEGYVRVEFLDNSKDAELPWQAESLKRLPQVLEDLQLRGFQPDRVCILVRKNTEAQAVVQHLLQYKLEARAQPDLCYDIIGNEGLSIASSPVVRFIINVLQLVVNPENSIAHKLVEIAVSKSSKDEGARHGYDTGSDGFFVKLQQISALPLFEMVETVVSLFELGSWHNAPVFIQAFQDLVYQYITGKSASLNDFLAWWTDEGSKKMVSVSDSQRAFRILTVHKSKGLDFDAVIIPFADWKMENTGTKADILWCQIKVGQFAELPLCPVDYGSALKNSIFADDYYNEKTLQLVDNLNVAYVAFTRPKHELICFAPYSEKSKSGDNLKINSFNLLMSECFQQENLKEFFDPENRILEIGKPVVMYKEDKQICNDEQVENYPTISKIKTLKITAKSIDFWENNKAAERVNFGKIMHEILQIIRTRADQPRALAQMVMQGKITHEESLKIDAEMEKFWDIPQTKQWFDNENIILTEKTIITPEGKKYRPDRILLNANRATVIDYKFGEQEQPQYITQMKTYINLLTQMNYSCEGIICYVKLKKVQFL
ncbi:MAG: UvrD-helicase domain-containing protein [Prevotellaceae bacterium]|jgi:ATP-dependent exoDNAse (exonuclease V) beta subunit|nr:UvrD-helicase domain-containing protein [Prevotellaceae bacterium]